MISTPSLYAARSSVSSGGIFSIDGRERFDDKQAQTLFLTRPLMLGSDEFKPHRCLYCLYVGGRRCRFYDSAGGSNDLEKWSVVFTLAGLLRARHAGVSWRYYRIRFTTSASGTEPFAISSFDIEYYSRFTRHLRARQ